MHELPVVKEVLSTVLKYAEEEKADRVLSISLEYGGMHDLVEELVVKFFHYISKDTVAEGAEIIVQKNPVLIRCRGCGEGFVFNPHGHLEFHCKYCGSEEFDMLTGNEFRIKNIALEYSKKEVFV